jgi:hypothetical protein
MQTVPRSYQVIPSEPPSSHALVLIGTNSRGQWVALQQDGLFGGLFANRIDAVRYALFENGHRIDSIVSVPGPLELDMSERTSRPRQAPSLLQAITSAQRAA